MRENQELWSVHSKTWGHLNAEHVTWDDSGVFSLSSVTRDGKSVGRIWWLPSHEVTRILPPSHGGE